MKKIVCSVMNDKYVKEYELTFEEQEMNNFLENLERSEILPVCNRDDMVRVYPMMKEVEEFDKRNTLLNYDNIKSYIRRLHESSDIDLTELYILMKSNGDMRSNQVRELFRNFLNLYNYREIATYDMYYINDIIREFYKFGSEASAPKIDCAVIRMNTVVLEEIGFSIDKKIEEQEKQKQKVIK